MQFAAEASGKKVTQLGLDDLHAGAVSDFLASLEDRRHNAPQSRNQRLAAIRTFFNYVGRRFPDRLGQAQKVTTIPRKRHSSRKPYSWSAMRLTAHWLAYRHHLGFAIVLCCCFCTTPEHVSRRQPASAPTTCTSIRIRVCTFTGKATSGASVLFGNRLPRSSNE